MWICFLSKFDNQHPLHVSDGGRDAMRAGLPLVTSVLFNLYYVAIPNCRALLHHVFVGLVFARRHFGRCM